VEKRLSKSEVVQEVASECKGMPEDTEENAIEEGVVVKEKETEVEQSLADEENAGAGKISGVVSEKELASVLVDQPADSPIAPREPLEIESSQPKEVPEAINLVEGEHLAPRTVEDQSPDATEMEQCKHCQRTFLKKRLAIHLQSCQDGKPLKSRRALSIRKQPKQNKQGSPRAHEAGVNDISLVEDISLIATPKTGAEPEVAPIDKATTYDAH